LPPPRLRLAVYDAVRWLREKSSYAMPLSPGVRELPSASVRGDRVVAIILRGR